MQEVLGNGSSGVHSDSDGNNSGNNSGNCNDQLDERLVAKAALDAAEEELRALCASNARVFVSVERRGVALESALSAMQISIKDAEPDVSNAQQSLDPDEETKETHSLAIMSERHRVRRRTLLQHSSLLELLELSSLMDACVRSNLYEEALSVAAFSNTLERRHGVAPPDNFEEKSAAVIVGKVVAQIRSRQTDLRRHLLNRLKARVSMPQCLEIVTALRRLNSIDLERKGRQVEATSLERMHAAMESHLQVDFLEARDSWLESFDTSSNNNTANGTSNASGTNVHSNATRSSEHLLDTIERYRTRCFEIATQFLAIFLADSSVSSSKFKQKSSSSSPPALLSMWTTRRIHSFLSMLGVQLNRMEDSASLRDALEACAFFATSMGRLGADFTAQLPPLFEPKMLSLVVAHWTDGTLALAETLKVCRDAGVASPLVSVSIAGISSEGGATVTTMATSAAATLADRTPGPPRQLLTLPPLARMLNSFLTGLNELRRCLFSGNFSSLRLALENKVIAHVKQVLQTNERAVLTPGLRGEAKELREVAARMKVMFGEVVEPYMRGALETALGDYESAKVYLHKEVDTEINGVATGGISEEEEQVVTNKVNRDVHQDDTAADEQAGSNDEIERCVKQELIETLTQSEHAMETPEVVVSCEEGSEKEDVDGIYD